MLEQASSRETLNGTKLEIPESTALSKNKVSTSGRTLQQRKSLMSCTAFVTVVVSLGLAIIVFKLSNTCGWKTELKSLMAQLNFGTSEPPWKSALFCSVWNWHGSSEALTRTACVAASKSLGLASPPAAMVLRKRLTVLTSSFHWLIAFSMSCVEGLETVSRRQLVWRLRSLYEDGRAAAREVMARREVAIVAFILIDVVVVVVVVGVAVCRCCC